MTSMLIGKILCIALFAIGIAIGYLDGVPGWGLAIVLIPSVTFLYAWGCHKAEIEGAKSALIGFLGQLPPSDASHTQSTPADE